MGDVNNDNWPDIFYPTLIGNNFTNGKLYINNKDGTFIDKTIEYFSNNGKLLHGGNACVFVDVDNNNKKE